jgi:hypothetical protein
MPRPMLWTRVIPITPSLPMLTPPRLVPYNYDANSHQPLYNYMNRQLVNPQIRTDPMLATYYSLMAQSPGRSLYADYNLNSWLSSFSFTQRPLIRPQARILPIMNEYFSMVINPNRLMPINSPWQTSHNIMYKKVPNPAFLYF